MEGPASSCGLRNGKHAELFMNTMMTMMMMMIKTGKKFTKMNKFYFCHVVT